MRKKVLIWQKHSCTNSCRFTLREFGIIHTKSAPRLNPEALTNHYGIIAYSLTNFKLPTVFSDFTVTKYMPWLRLSRFRVVMPWAWL